MPSFQEMLQSGELYAWFNPGVIAAFREANLLAVRYNSEILTASHLVTTLYISENTAEVISGELPDTPEEKPDPFNPRPVKPDPLPYDPIPTIGFQASLNTALEEAERFNQRYVTKPLLWLGVINKEGDEGIEMISEIGIDIPAFRGNIEESLSSPIPQIVIPYWIFNAPLN